jgi:small ligand-binding sensory domain FIST
MQAAEVAAAAALAPLAGRTPDLALVFVSGADAGPAGERALELTGARSTIGCSAGGVIGGGVGVQGISAVSVWAAVLPGARLRTFHLEVLPSAGAAAVVGLPELPGGDDDVMLLLADPYSFPAEGFVQQAAVAMPGLPLVGALAQGLTGPGSTRLFVDGRTVARGAVGVVMSGTAARALVSQGCRPVGPVMTVTAAEGQVVRGLAGAPAADKMRSILTDLSPPDQALATSGLHLGIAAAESGDDQEYLVRAVIGTARDDGIVVDHRVEVGQSVQLQVRDADAAHADLIDLLKRHGDVPGAGTLLFSNIGRGASVFGPSLGGASHDPTVVRETLAADAVAGCFTAGEIGPVGGEAHLHGFTATMLVFP